MLYNPSGDSLLLAFNICVSKADFHTEVEQILFCSFCVAQAPGETSDAFYCSDRIELNRARAIKLKKKKRRYFVALYWHIN